jgi:hypothetical protein
LDLTDPHRHPGQFGGVGVDLDALDGLRTDARKLATQPQCLGLDRDAVLDVFQCQQRQIEEIARAACRVEDSEGA